METFILKSVIWTIFFSVVVFAKDEDAALREQVRALAEQMNTMKTIQNMEVAALKQEIEELKNVTSATSALLQKSPSMVSMEEEIKKMKLDINHVARRVNSSVILRMLRRYKAHYEKLEHKYMGLTNFINENSENIARLENAVESMKETLQKHQNIANDLRQQFVKLSKEVRNGEKSAATNEVDDDHSDEEHTESSGSNETHHRLRHSKTIRRQIAKLTKMFNIMEEVNQGIRFQLVDVQKQLEKYHVNEMDSINGRMTFTELRINMLQLYFTNVSHRMQDLERLHKSVLELREEIEEMQMKAEKSEPEIRKEISKIDINVAQLVAQVSYLKEGQENLRQSVKAIAVSVSNTMDRAEADRALMKQINESVSDLEAKQKQHFHRLNDHILKTESTYVATNNSDEISLSELMGDVKELQPVEKEYEDLVEKLPRECSEVTGAAGIYMIHPGRAPIDNYCVNGTTLLQRRFNGSIEFNRKFAEYAKGFGNPASEYWMGLEDMSLLTHDNCSGMRIDMVDIYGGAWFAEYDYFNVGTSDTGYTLTVAGFKGNASDAFDYQNHMEFSAIDHDRDISNSHCAGNYEGGWWYSHCQHVNINGKYSLGLTWFDNGKNEWIAVAASEMRMFRTC